MLPKQSERHVTSSSSSTETETTKVKNIHTKKLLLRPACGKFIYVTRNLPDVCASFYHHLSNQKEGTYIGDFTTFFHDWMDGSTIPFGSPLHHLISFAEGFGHNQYYSAPDEGAVAGEDAPKTTTIHQKCTYSDINQCQDLWHHYHHQQQQQSSLLLLSYEKMKTNLRQEVLKIIDFLQLDNISMKVLDTELLPTFGFQFMKENSHMFQPKSVTWLNGYQFLRKGEIGDGTKMLLMLMETTTTTATKAPSGTNARTGSPSDEEAEVTVPLMDMFHDWVRKEGYCRKIRELESRGLTREASEQFLAIVHEVCGWEEKL